MPTGACMCLEVSGSLALGLYYHVTTVVLPAHAVHTPCWPSSSAACPRRLVKMEDVQVSSQDHAPVGIYCYTINVPPAAASCRQTNLPPCSRNAGFLKWVYYCCTVGWTKNQYQVLFTPWNKNSTFDTRKPFSVSGCVHLAPLEPAPAS